MTDQHRHTPSAVHVEPLEAPTPHTRVLWPDGMACRHQRAALRVVSLQRAGKYKRPVWRPLQGQKGIDEWAIMAAQ
jgi:hypothetical protein